jgi:hypothetical protein
MAHRKRAIDKDPVTALFSPVDKPVRCKQPVDGVVVDVALNHQHVHLASSGVCARSESEHGAKRHMRFAHMITKGHKVGHTLERTIGRMGFAHVITKGHKVGHTLERTIGRMGFAHMITKGHKVGHTLEQMVGHTLERTIGHMVGHTEYATSTDTHSNRCWTNGRNMAGRVAGYMASHMARHMAGHMAWQVTR